MEVRTGRQSMYPTARQKKKLVEMMAQHPELVKCKLSANFTQKDIQRLWLEISNECNAIPGAKKSWRQWRKTWQDMKTKFKKKQKTGANDIMESVITLTSAQQEALGFKNVSSTTANHHESTEFAALDVQEQYEPEISYLRVSGPESPSEEKVFTQPYSKINPEMSQTNLTSEVNEHSNNCVFNCDMLAIQEQRKLQIKEDYYSFKQNYLRQKLLLMKEQTEALKSIAKELAK